MKGLFIFVKNKKKPILFSSSPMASQYLGCRVSLISKADVRYEGILYSIDPDKSEVVLQNGKIEDFKVFCF